uniref:Uncharacterized protein n=1 Tax=Glossina pallidipes TaxID=7398 RepID=A0A1B0ACR1_GLOPL
MTLSRHIVLSSIVVLHCSNPVLVVAIISSNLTGYRHKRIQVSSNQLVGLLVAIRLSSSVIYIVIIYVVAIYDEGIRNYMNACYYKSRRLLSLKAEAMASSPVIRHHSFTINNCFYANIKTGFTSFQFHLLSLSLATQQTKLAVAKNIAVCWDL